MKYNSVSSATSLLLTALALTSGCGGGDGQEKGDGGSRSQTPKKIDNPEPPGRPVPILMYHVIAGPPAGAPYPELYVTADNFKSQVEALESEGYNAVTLDQAYNYWHKGAKLPRNPVVLSFDDGYRSVYENAYPVMRRLDWPGVVNLEIKIMDDVWGLNPEMVKKLIDAGWEIDSHSVNHLDVSTLDAAGLEQEIASSRRRLKSLFKVPVNFFCYPAGRYNDAAIEAVKKAGYLGATTTDNGLARAGEPYTLARVRVNGSDTAQSLLDKLQALGS